MRSRFLRPHAGQRLVEQQHLGLAGQRHGDLELALLAVRRACRRCAPRRPARPTRASARRAPSRSGPARAAAPRSRLPAPAAHRLRGEAHVLEHGQRRRRCWCAGTSGRCRARVMRQAGSPATSRPSSSMRPARRPDLAGEQVDERGLAGAVRADHGMQLAAGAARSRRRARRRGRRRLRVRPCVASTGGRWARLSHAGAPRRRRGAVAGARCRPRAASAAARMPLKPFGSASTTSRMTSAFDQQLALGDQLRRLRRGR